MLHHWYLPSSEAMQMTLIDLAKRTPLDSEPGTLAPHQPILIASLLDLSWGPADIRISCSIDNFIVMSRPCLISSSNVMQKTAL